jgi:hypothetical protein
MNAMPDAILKQLSALSARPEKAIDFTDLPPAHAKDWKGAVRGRFYRPVKQLARPV